MKSAIVSSYQVKLRNPCSRALSRDQYISSSPPHSPRAIVLCRFCKMRLVICALLLSVVASIGVAFPTGAPNFICGLMIPLHGAHPQEGSGNYTISVNSTGVLEQNQTYTGQNQSCACIGRNNNGRVTEILFCSQTGRSRSILRLPHSSVHQ